jgi:regulator of RNase E activity RraA
MNGLLRRAIRTRGLVVLGLLLGGVALVACEEGRPPATGEGTATAEDTATVEGTATTYDDPLLAGFAASYTATIADAVDQVVGQRGYLDYDVKPQVPGNFVGRAVTVLMRPATPEESTPTLALQHSVEMLDGAQLGEVGIFVVEGSLNVAAMGDMLGLTAKSRGMAGVVIDGAVRDVARLREIGLPVFARSVSPATAVGRYATVARQIPVEVTGVTIRPGDIIVADEDGVVVVPQEHGEAVLQRAREIDQREAEMAPKILEYRSLQRAIAEFNRI